MISSEDLKKWKRKDYEAAASYERWQYMIAQKREVRTRLAMLGIYALIAAAITLLVWS